VSLQRRGGGSSVLKGGSTKRGNYVKISKGVGKPSQAEKRKPDIPDLHEAGADIGHRPLTIKSGLGRQMLKKGGMVSL